MSKTNLDVNSTDLDTLLKDMKKGDIRLPRFQRDYVWDTKKTEELLDSMSRNYPIGTFFLWKASKDYNRMIRRIREFAQPKLDMNKEHSLILDGQQRLISLYAVKNGCKLKLNRKEIDFSKFAVNLDEYSQEIPFEYKVESIDNQQWVRMRDVLSENWWDLYQKIACPERQKRLGDLHYILIKYKISMVVVDVRDHAGTDELRQAVKIFTRINKSGRRLSRFDLVAANLYDGKFDLRDRVKKDVLVPLARGKYDKISPEIIPQLLAINLREKNVNLNTQLGMTTKKVEPIWGETVQSIHKAVDHFREHLGAVRDDFLPYDRFIAIFAHFYYLLKKEKRLASTYENTQIELWFWRAAFGERYIGSVPTHMQEDAQWVRSLVTSRTKAALADIKLDVKRIKELKMKQKSAVRKGIMCLLVLQNPRHFVNGKSISLDNQHFSKLTIAEKHHIFPYAFLKEKKGLRDVQRLPNFCFIPADLNKQINRKAPSKYFEEYKNGHSKDEFKSILDSHVIRVDNESAVWEDDYDKFLDQRASMLLEKAKELAGVN